MDAKQPETPLRSVALLWALCVSVCAAAWAIASPVGASPDEPAHIAYAWGLATGQDVLDSPNNCGQDNCSLVVSVPVGLMPDPSCHQRRPEVSAGCEPTRHIVSQTSRTIRYPPPYYLITGLGMRASMGVGLSPASASLVGRLLGAALTLSTLVPALVLATRRIRALVPYLIVPLTPMTMFVVSAINPNGAEIGGGIAAATAVVVYSRTLKHDALTSYVFLAGMFWLTWSRPLGFLWAGAVGVFGLLYIHAGHHATQSSVADTARRLARVWIPATVSLVLAMAWFGYAIGAWTTVGSSRSPNTVLTALVGTPLRWGGILWEFVGVLGWLFTPLPTLSVILTIGCVAAMLTLSQVSGPDGGPQRRVAAVYLASIVAGVTALMFYNNFLWQGRYVIAPLGVFAILWGGSATDEFAGRVSKLATWCWVLSSTSALWIAARYSWGLEVRARFVSPDFVDADWSPSGGTPLFLVLSVLGIVGVPLALRRTVPPRASEPEHTSKETGSVLPER